MVKEYTGIQEIVGPLILVGGVRDVSYQELVEIELPNGELRQGRVLEVDQDKALVQVFEGTTGANIFKSKIRFLGKGIELGVSIDILGRIFNGMGKPIDKGPRIIPEKKLDINGLPINPYARNYPNEFIQTGISTIDGLNTLVRGQKLPIFSGAGLPHPELAAQIARQAKVLGTGIPENPKASSGAGIFAVIFGAMGVTFEEANFFIQDFKRTAAIERSVLFINLANDPAIERLATPRMALTAAEYLAFEKDMHILVILSDMTNYCLSKETELILNDGTIIEIGTLVNTTMQGGNFLNKKILSWDSICPTINKITAVQKIPWNGPLLKIRTRSSNEIICTPDHKILADTPNGPQMVGAGNLRKGDNLYATTSLFIESKKLNLLNLLPDNFILGLHPPYMSLLKKHLKNKYNNYSTACRELGLSKWRLSDKRYTLSIKEVNIILSSLPTDSYSIIHNINYISYKASKKRHKINLNLFSDDFLYLAGLIASDGSLISKKGNYYRVDFSNKNQKILNTYEEKIIKLFPGIAIKKNINQNGIIILRCNNALLYHLFTNLFEGNLKNIFCLEENLIANFLKGYFDGDGCCIKNKIIYTSNNYKIIKRLQQLLKRLSIRSHINKRQTGFINSISFDIIIRGQRDVNLFRKKIGTNHPEKEKKLDFINSRTCSKFDILPQKCRILFKELRSRYAIPLSNTIFKDTGHVFKFENGKREISKVTFNKWLNEIESKVDCNGEISILRKLSSDEFYLDELVEISEVHNSSPFVYDISVSETHKFIVDNGLVISNCEALRQVSSARKEVPGRRGYPGYMYTDLATLYERAGRIKGKKGSITLMPILTMPEDDKTHPIPDLTGYITEGQLILSRSLHKKGIYPPIDPLPSLSRLKDKGIGKGKTREDHSDLFNQLFAAYARGREAHELAVILGEEALSEVERKFYKFSDQFEIEYIRQGMDENRSIETTLDIGWKLLSMLPRTELKRVRIEYLDKYLPK